MLTWRCFGCPTCTGGLGTLPLPPLGNAVTLKMTNWYWLHMQCLLGFGLSTGVICYLIKKYICGRLNRIEIFLSKREIYKLDIIKFIECFTNNKSDKKNFKIQEVPAFLVPKSNHEMRGSWIPRTVFSVKPKNESQKIHFLSLFFMKYWFFPLFK